MNAEVPSESEKNTKRRLGHFAGKFVAKFVGHSEPTAHEDGPPEPAVAAPSVASQI